MTVIEESLTAKGYTPAAQVPSAFGAPRTIQGIVIHHWGLPGQTHDGVVNFFVNGPGQTSAHYVASEGRIHCLVSPEDAAWHCPGKNATHIGIECRPEATDGDYATVAELVRTLRTQYGPLPLSMHRDWYNTACPGVWDLARIDQLAGAGTITTQSQTITPLEDDMPSANEIAQAILDFKVNQVGKGQSGQINLGALLAEYRVNNNNIVENTSAWIMPEVIALRELVKQLSVKQGVTIDYDAIAKAVNDNAAARMVK